MITLCTPQTAIKQEMSAGDKRPREDAVEDAVDAPAAKRQNMGGRPSQGFSRVDRLMWLVNNQGFSFLATDNAARNLAEADNRGRCKDDGETFLLSMAPSAIKRHLTSRRHKNTIPPPKGSSQSTIEPVMAEAPAVTAVRARKEQERLARQVLTLDVASCGIP